MNKFTRNILPHAAIVISLMYVVFYFIDRVNSAMAFINNGLTKVLLLVLSAVSVLIARQILSDDRKREALRRRRAREQARSARR